MVESDGKGGGKVLRPQFGDAKLVRDRWENDPFCAHEYVAVRKNSRVVICRVCEQPVDAFDVLLRMVTDWDRVTHQQQALERLSEEVAELKREEANTKSRLRAANKLGAPEPRSKIFFDELMRRIGEACSRAAIWEANRYATEFKWLEPEQYKAIQDALFLAEQRAEASARHTPNRKRAVRVIKGGAT